MAKIPKDILLLLLQDYGVTALNNDTSIALVRKAATELIPPHELEAVREKIDSLHSDASLEAIKMFCISNHIQYRSSSKKVMLFFLDKCGYDVSAIPTREPNEEQLKVINSDEPRILVNAGPGTGKTFTALRIVRRARIEDKRVLMLSHLNESCAELRDRLRGMGLRSIADKYRPHAELCVCTICSMAWHYSDKEDSDTRRIESAIRNDDDSMSNFDLVVLDEAQDTSARQWVLLKKRWANVKQVFVLGDPRQRVSPDASNYFEQLWSQDEWTRLALRKSYRSTSKIIDFVNAISKKTGNIHVDLTAERKVVGNPPVIYKVADDEDINSRVIQYIDERRIQGMSLNDIAILTPTVRGEKGSLVPALGGLASIAGIHYHIMTAAGERIDPPNVAHMKISNPIHAKGKEYKLVIMVEFDQRFPFARANPRTSLYYFYVACSRAVDELVFFYKDKLTPFMQGLVSLCDANDIPQIALRRRPSFQRAIVVTDLVKTSGYEYVAADELKEAQHIKEFLSRSTASLGNLKNHTISCNSGQRGTSWPVSNRSTASLGNLKNHTISCNSGQRGTSWPVPKISRPSSIPPTLFGNFVENYIKYAINKQFPPHVMAFANDELVMLPWKLYKHWADITGGARYWFKDVAIGKRVIKANTLVTRVSDGLEISGNERCRIQEILAAKTVTMHDIWYVTFFEALLTAEWTDRTLINESKSLNEVNINAAIEAISTWLQSLGTVDTNVSQTQRCRIVGIPDAILSKDGVQTIVEIKATSSIELAHRLQANLYAEMLEIKKCIIINAICGEAIMFDATTNLLSRSTAFATAYLFDKFTEAYIEWLYQQDSMKSIQLDGNMIVANACNEFGCAALQIDRPEVFYTCDSLADDGMRMFLRGADKIALRESKNDDSTVINVPKLLMHWLNLNNQLNCGFDRHTALNRIYYEITGMDPPRNGSIDVMLDAAIIASIIRIIKK